MTDEELARLKARIDAGVVTQKEFARTQVPTSPVAEADILVMLSRWNDLVARVNNVFADQQEGRQSLPNEPPTTEFDTIEALVLADQIAGWCASGHCSADPQPLRELSAYLWWWSLALRQEFPDQIEIFLAKQDQVQLWRDAVKAINLIRAAAHHQAKQAAVQRETRNDNDLQHRLDLAEHALSKRQKPMFRSLRDMKPHTISQLASTDRTLEAALKMARRIEAKLLSMPNVMLQLDVNAESALLADRRVKGRE